MVPEQCYAVLEHGQIVARCQVYGRGTMAQIEHVYTLAAHRRKGYASAVVTHAARAARASGALNVFLLTDADAWQSLYARIGFVEAGLMPRFLRLLS